MFWLRNKKINFILDTLIDLEVSWLICDYLPSSSWARRMFPGFISLCRNPCSLRCFIPSTGKKNASNHDSVLHQAQIHWFR